MTRPYRSNIPVARKQLTDIAKALNDGLIKPTTAAGLILDVVKTKMHSHTPDRRAPRKTVTTKTKSRQAVDLRDRYPTASQLEIAISVGTNQGRVSEAIHSQKKKPPGGTLLLLALVGGLLLASGEGRAEDLSEISVTNAAYCSLFARSEVLHDALHGTDLTADSDFILARAKEHYAACLAVLPDLLPVSDDLKTWLADIRDLLVLRDAERVASIGTVPASENPDDAAWREACRAEYMTWSEADGTVIRNGSPDRVRCPLTHVDGTWGLPE